MMCTEKSVLDKEKLFTNGQKLGLPSQTCFKKIIHREKTLGLRYIKNILVTFVWKERQTNMKGRITINFFEKDAG